MSGCICGQGGFMATLVLVLGWIIVVGFAVTFLVTIGALIGKFKISRKYLALFVTKLVLEVVAAGFFLFYNGITEPRHPYSGEWKGVVFWKDDYARRLLNYEGTDNSFKPANTRSEGNMYLYKSNTGAYAGFSIWATKNGEQTYSQLAVIPSDITFDALGRISSICLKTIFRKPLIQFSYAPYTHYHMRFTEVSESRLRGKMIAVINDEEVEAGEVILERY